MDEFLHELRTAPPTAFATQLHSRLRRQGASPLHRAVRIAIGMAALLMIAIISAGPIFGVSARDLLQRFLIRQFEPMRASFHHSDPRMLDARRLLGRQIRHEGEATARHVDNLAAGEAWFGMRARLPRRLPEGFSLSEVHVVEPNRAEFAASVAILRQSLAVAGITDVQIPDGIDGQQIRIATQGLLSLTYRGPGGHRIEVVQGKSPFVALPAGLEFATFAEVSMRLAGVEAVDARRLAHAVDWRTTLMVPLPVSAKSFQAVTVEGNPGLLIETGAPKAGQPPEIQSTLFWAETGLVYVVTSTLLAADLPAIADSLR